MTFSDRKILLASKSPRRSRLLKEAGFKFDIIPLDVEETYPETMNVEEVPGFLAQKKARAATGHLQADEIILAADSVVILKERIFGKPAGPEEAVTILKELSGQKHRVITGVCLLSKDKEKVFSSITDVYMEPLSQVEIEYYIQKFQPFDKAGAYAIQEWIGLCKISKIEGTYTNVMGLPVDMVYKELVKF